MQDFLSIIWDPSVIAFKIGAFGVRWYSLLWMLGLVGGYFTAYKVYDKEGIGQDKFEPLFIYAFLGILIGARLGHCLLYQPDYYLAHPVEMLLPIKKLPVGWKFVGYQGLASHGGSIGVLIGLWLYVRRYKMNTLRVLDMMALATPITACCIRLGNLMNSEIVGKQTESALGFVFKHNGEDFARYPAQLFEGLWYLVVFVVGLALYRKWKEKVGTGFFFGYLLTTVFSFRFLIEFLKEVQEPWEQGMVQMIGLNQGQLLSLPFIVVGIYCWMGGKYCKKWSFKRT